MMWERDTSAGECPDEDEGSTTISDGNEGSTNITDGNEGSSGITDGSTSHIIRGLEEDSNYTISVRANNAFWSAVIESASGVTREAGIKLLYTH